MYLPKLLGECTKIVVFQGEKGKASEFADCLGHRTHSIITTLNLL
jgi:hypothetical protein